MLYLVPICLTRKRFSVSSPVSRASSYNSLKLNAFSISLYKSFEVSASIKSINNINLRYYDELFYKIINSSIYCSGNG